MIAVAARGSLRILPSGCRSPRLAQPRPALAPAAEGGLGGEARGSTCPLPSNPSPARRGREPTASTTRARWWGGPTTGTREPAGGGPRASSGTRWRNPASPFARRRERRPGASTTPGRRPGFVHRRPAVQRAVRWRHGARHDGRHRPRHAGQRDDGRAGATSTAYDLNDDGVRSPATRTSRTTRGLHPFHAILFTDAEGCTDLGTFDTSTLLPERLTASRTPPSHGQAVGLAHNSSWSFRPFIGRRPGGAARAPDRPRLSPNEWYAVAVNDDGSDRRPRDRGVRPVAALLLGERDDRAVRPCRCRPPSRTGRSTGSTRRA